MANKRKTTTALAAGVTAVALLLGGTFAWTSISQQAKNESAGIVNVGGRLHDDFNGKNKDVYVENFTDPYNGGQPIYARVRLDEYMEVGKDAGGIDVDKDGTIDAVPVITGTGREDVTSWKPHVPSTACAVCKSGNTCLIHDHWTWTMGGDNNTTGSTTFMPTFNKDKDSLDADVNGTYAGTNPDDKVYYDDYVTYVTAGGAVVDLTADFTQPDGAQTANALTEVNTNVTTVTGNAQYDNDPDTDKNTVENDHYILKKETHTAKETATATVITMEQWLSEDTTNGGKGGAPGDYWVYDDDGWAYWANPIMPGEATGLLLDGIEMTSNPGEKCYYAINVVGQFATVGDWEYFDGFDETENANALKVLTAASGNIPTVTVTNQNKVTLVNRGATVNFSASTAVGAVSTLADTDEYEWIVLDEDLKKSETSTIKDNGDGTATLTVGDEELSAGLYVAARSKNHGGAVGLSAVAVQHYTVNISAENNTTVLKAGKTLQFSAEVVDKGTGDPETSGVTWTVSGGNGKSKVSDDGVLTIDQDEAGLTTLTITATTKATGAFFATYTVTVADKYAVTISQADNATVVFHGEPLQFTAEVTKNGAAETSGVTWEVTGGSGNTSISENGLLTIDDNETQAATLTVTATSKADSEVKATYSVTVAYKYDVLEPGTVIDADETSEIPLAAKLNGTTVTDVVWTIVGNTDSNTRIENGNLYLGVNETAAEITLTARNANGKGSQQLSLRYEMQLVFFRYNDFDSVNDTIEDGANRDSSPWGDNMTSQIRVCRTNGAIIDGATMTFEVDGVNVTGYQDGNCTNGFIEAGSEADSVKDGHDYWWAWTPNDNTATVTISVTHGESTFEATIW